MSWTDVALVLESGIVIVGIPLVALYSKERVKNVAREVTDRALADHRHEHEKRLEAIRAEHSRLAEQFTLYERQRHRAYARVFRRYRIAADLHSGLAAMYTIPDFATFSESDVTAYLKKHKVSDQIGEPARRAFRAQQIPLFKARMIEIDDQVRLQEANVAYHHARNAEALEELYLSDPVRHKLDALRAAIMAYFVQIRRNVSDPSDLAVEKKDAMETELQQLYNTMRDELRRQ